MMTRGSCVVGTETEDGEAHVRVSVRGLRALDSNLKLRQVVQCVLHHKERRLWGLAYSESLLIESHKGRLGRHRKCPGDTFHFPSCGPKGCDGRP